MTKMIPKKPEAKMASKLSSNRLMRVMTALYCEPWLITPTMHRVISDIVQAHAEGGEAEAEQHMLAAGMPEQKRKAEYSVLDGVAVVSVEGVIGRKFSSMLRSSGVVSVDVLERVLVEAAQDKAVQGIVTVFDTPGGTAGGVAEVAKTISQINEVKPMIAYADGLCCSAGYWLAAHMSAIYATESADVGSIGVYMAILDQSRFAEMQGLKVEMFKSGRFKGMGYPGTSLTDEQRAKIQADVDRLAAKFKGVVRAGRGEIDDEVMQGQSFDADQALANGLIDSVGTLDMAVRDVLSLAKLRAGR